MDPKVAMDLAGDFVVTWQSYGQDGSGYGIYARRYNAAAAAQGNEFLVNNLITANWQMTPDVGMDANGDFIITWSSFGQDQQASTGLPVAGYSYYGISCRMFNADGSDYQFTDPTTGKVTSGEWRVNATLNSNEMTPVIGVGQNEEFAIAWVQDKLQRQPDLLAAGQSGPHGHDGEHQRPDQRGRQPAVAGCHVELYRLLERQGRQPAPASPATASMFPSMADRFPCG